MEKDYTSELDELEATLTALHAEAAGEQDPRLQALDRRFLAALETARAALQAGDQAGAKAGIKEMQQVLADVAKLKQSRYDLLIKYSDQGFDSASNWLIVNPATSQWETRQCAPNSDTPERWRSVIYKTMLAFGLPVNVDAFLLPAFMSEQADLLKRIKDGYSIDDDKNNEKGHYTDEAESAVDTLEEYARDAPTLTRYTLEDFAQRHDIDEDTTDDALEAMYADIAVQVEERGGYEEDIYIDLFQMRNEERDSLVATH